MLGRKARDILSVFVIFQIRKQRQTCWKSTAIRKKARLDHSKRVNGNVARITSTPTSPHSSTFIVSFAKGGIETDLMNDQGADANFISSRMFKEIKHKQPKIHQKELIPAQIYRDVTGAPCQTCKSAAE